MHMHSQYFGLDLFSLLFRNNKNKWLFQIAIEAADTTFFFFDFGEKLYLMYPFLNFKASLL